MRELKIGDIVTSNRDWSKNTTSSEYDGLKRLDMTIREGDKFVVGRDGGVNSAGLQCIYLRGVPIRFLHSHFTYIGTESSVKTMSQRLADDICLT